MAAYLEKRKTILQTANQCVERGDRSDDGYNIPGAAPKISEDVGGDDNNIHLMVRERRQRKSSFISKSLNDPKLLEVNIHNFGGNCQKNIFQIISPSVADLYSRFIFPIVFLVFNIFYWSFYLYHANSSDTSFANLKK